jgi:predicted ATPase
MIEEIHLRNFKCFADQPLKLSPMTLLAGLNGMGKSSVIQALLLLRQSYLSGAFERGCLETAGEFVDLGTASDVLFEGAEEDRIGIAIRHQHPSGAVAAFSFEVKSEHGHGTAVDMSAHSADIRRMTTGRHPSIIFADHGDYDWRAGTFQYLHAERHGPRKFLPMSRTRSGVIELGARGEYVLHALALHQNIIQLPPDDPRHLPATGERLRDQVEAWLDVVSPGVRLTVEAVPQADLVVGGFSFGEAGQLRSRDYRATNVGFGLSYVLPVLVALLAARPGGLVIIENPEAHMHPLGQTRLGELCARTAAAGAQVLIETHSDHVLDGVRIAVRDGIVAPNDAVFHYFRRQQGRAEVLTPSIDAEGRLSEWPDGFFDQHRRNTARLIRPRKF